MAPATSATDQTNDNINEVSEDPAEWVMTQ